MSNYPPGVTGREFAIAGWDVEQDETREVEQCGNRECGPYWEGPVNAEGMFLRFGSESEFQWECPACGHRNTEDLPEEEWDGPEPDDYWD